MLMEVTTKTPTPPEGIAAAKAPSNSLRAMRRVGARHEVSERVVLREFMAAEGVVGFEGWALNVSRGGLRVILEEKGVALGGDVEITIGEDEVSRRGRVVWIQEEPDGVIVGIEFTSLSGIHKSVPPAPITSRRLPGVEVEGERDSEPGDKPEG